MNPMDGWLYLSQEDVDSLPVDGRRVHSYGMSGREKEDVIANGWLVPRLGSLRR